MKMAYQIKTERSKPSVGADTTLYQVTAAKDFVITTLRIVNMTAAAETVKIAVSATATPGADEWIFRAEIKPLMPVQLSGDLVLGGKFIVVHNETAGGVIFALTGYESV
jgi:hypothetical protein